MDRRIVREINSFEIKRYLKKAVRKLALVLACVAVFCTTYALMLPAVTQEAEPTLHTHDDTCNVQVCSCGFEEEPHVHDETCYETEFVEEQVFNRLVCQLTE